MPLVSLLEATVKSWLFRLELGLDEVLVWRDASSS